MAGGSGYPPVHATIPPITPPRYQSLDGANRAAGLNTMPSANDSAHGHSGAGPVDSSTNARKRRFEEEDVHPKGEEQVRLGMQFGQSGSTISPEAYRSYNDFPRSSYLPSIPAPAATKRSHDGMLTEETKGGSTAGGTTILAASTNRYRSRAGMFVEGEISEEQRGFQERQMGYQGGHGVPRRADISPPSLLEPRVLPPSVGTY